jgi:hypothetical protein
MNQSNLNISIKKLNEYSNLIFSKDPSSKNNYSSTKTNLARRRTHDPIDNYFFAPCALATVLCSSVALKKKIMYSNSNIARRHSSSQDVITAAQAKAKNKPTKHDSQKKEREEKGISNRHHD